MWIDLLLKTCNASIGVIFQDHKGVVQCLFSIPVRIKNFNEAKLIAVIKALELHIIY